MPIIISLRLIIVQWGNVPVFSKCCKKTLFGAQNMPLQNMPSKNTMNKTPAQAFTPPADEKGHNLDIWVTDLNYWIKHPFEFSDPILKPEYL